MLLLTLLLAAPASPAEIDPVVALAWRQPVATPTAAPVPTPPKAAKAGCECECAVTGLCTCPGCPSKAKAEPGTKVVTEYQDVKLSDGTVVKVPVQVTYGPAAKVAVPKLAAQLDYDACKAFVEAGGKCVLAVGVNPPPGAYSTSTLKGIAPGLYECSLDKAGVPCMGVLQAPQQMAAPQQFGGQFRGTCGPGGCGPQQGGFGAGMQFGNFNMGFGASRCGPGGCR